MSARILVIDDEPQIHRFLQPALEAAGYQVERADTGGAGLRSAASRSPDLVLLDLGLPDLDGQEVLTRLRAFATMPVIILSARDQDREKIAALDGGADDYIEKPFSVGEMLARLRSALRHAQQRHQTPPILKAGDLEIDSIQHEVRLAGDPVQLSPREFALLAMLATNTGRVLTHRQLLTAIWGPAHADDVQYLRVYVGHLRAKLGAEGPRLIRTEPGVGYRFTPG